ncbi:flagellar basal-body rod protein FlgF [Flocculibacter collagenilyticus]|uniref:flagellar basal-body rod protein FlgF n=1 Tax=Flocculibacter collagenilyticus TaxID=2744479 RepID=UPI0018F454BC|nr:flagellar basal-body rod protein FlgF [Flocculibacter collagenilyticus]
MFQSFFTGLSGMFSFSKNLDNVSNNIANMNTPGFKGSDTFYSSLTSGSNSFGTQISGESQRFSTGEVRQTGNPGDIAIGGEGFFILLNEGEVQYTRAGQFKFNDDGILIDSVSGGEVASVNESGQLEVINISNARVLAPQATSSINFKGNLSSDMTSHDVSGIKVFNALGEEQELSVSFTNNTAVESGSWLVTVKDSNGVELHSGEIRFNTNGTPLSPHNTLKFETTDSNGGKSEIAMNFGNSNEFSHATSVSGGNSSTIQATVDDGYGIASLTTIDFSSDGTLKLNYSNGQIIDGPSIGLANFSNLSALEVVEGSVFRSSSDSSRVLGKPGESGMGNIMSESIELSNVDLSREFADMIIIQRGYQASSRILNVSNELLDQLYENTRG